MPYHKTLKKILSKPYQKTLSKNLIKNLKKVSYQGTLARV